MTGWLRKLSEHRIADRDRRRTFVMLVAIVVAAGVVLLATRPASRRSAAPQGSPHTAEAVTRSAISADPTTRENVIRMGRVFLGGYLRLVYGHASPGRVPDATAPLERELTSRRLVVAPAQRARDPRVASLNAARWGSGWRVRAVIADGGVADYPIVLTLTRKPEGRWRVSGVSD